MKQDDVAGSLIDEEGRKVSLPRRSSSDTCFRIMSIGRGRMWERIRGIEVLDASRIARAVEGTRFPGSIPSEGEALSEKTAIDRHCKGGGPDRGSWATHIIFARQTRWYLSVTSSGRTSIANLYSNVFRAERDISLFGPQK